MRRTVSVDLHLNSWALQTEFPIMDLDMSRKETALHRLNAVVSRLETSLGRRAEALNRAAMLEVENTRLTEEKNAALLKLEKTDTVHAEASERLDAAIEKVTKMLETA